MLKSISTHIEEVRSFNRFYTNILGLLNNAVFESPFSLSEVRVMFEIYSRNYCTARLLQEELNLDRGYISRIINKLEKQKLIYRERCKEDSRNQLLHFTDAGIQTYQELEAKSNEQIKLLLESLDEDNQKTLVYSMNTIKSVLSNSEIKKSQYIIIREDYSLRDIELMKKKQEDYYTKQVGFDASFITYLHQTFDGEIEKVWTAEMNGEFAGCIGLVKVDRKKTQLRWFFVESTIQGKGVGYKLLQSLIDYCIRQKYEQIVLITVNEQIAARNLYTKFGFHIIEEKEEQVLWGKRVVEEHWALDILSDYKHEN